MNLAMTVTVSLRFRLYFHCYLFNVTILVLSLHLLASGEFPRCLFNITVSTAGALKPEHSERLRMMHDVHCNNSLAVVRLLYRSAHYLQLLSTLTRSVCGT